jgi:hypothetical protein
MYDWYSNSYVCTEIYFDYPEVWRPASHKMDAENFPDVQRPERGADHSSTSSVEA